MRCTVQKEIQEAVAAYEDKPRDQWLFDYPAQVRLTAYTHSAGLEYHSSFIQHSKYVFPVFVSTPLTGGSDWQSGVVGHRRGHRL